MPDDIHARLASWHAAWPDLLRTGTAGMAAAGLLRIGLTETPGYAAIARLKDAIVEATGLPGLAGMCAGRQLVARFFLAGFGSAGQVAHFLPRLADGSAAFSVAISEPGVGAHPKNLTTRAMTDGTDTNGTDIVITGTKAWVSNALEATHLIVFAIVEETGTRKRYSAFLVPTDTPGLAIAPMPGFDALPPSRHCAVTLHACRVPASAQLGPSGTAFETMAMPFRDVEDAVSTAGMAGAFRATLRGLAPAAPEAANAELGALAGLVAVLDHGARAVVAALDAGRMRHEAAAGVGLRVLAADIRARLDGLIQQIAPPPDPARDRLLADLDALLSIARGPRAIRQARLGASLRPSPA